MLSKLTFFLMLLTLTVPAHADIVAIVVDENSVPYDLNSANYSNNPSNYANSSANYANASSTYGNSPSTYTNSSSTYENGPSGERNILDESGRRLGYYVTSQDGVTNFFNEDDRVAYIPSGGHTQSLFDSESGGWCGTVGKNDGKTVLGLTRTCFFKFYED